jgi:hypothetical protein
VDFVVRIKLENTRKEQITVVAVPEQSSTATPQQVQVSFVDVKYPKSTEDIKCNLDYDFIIRRVNRKNREMAEGYHKVIFMRGKGDKSEFTLIRKDELVATVYRIESGGDYLNFEGVGIINMLSYEDAFNFLRWLKDQKVLIVGKHRLRLSGRDLQKKDLKNLQIRSVNLN